MIPWYFFAWVLCALCFAYGLMGVFASGMASSGAPVPRKAWLSFAIGAGIWLLTLVIE